MSILITILVLGLLIFLHEGGHFIACRMTGVRVEKFSIGFGPELFAWQGKETRFTISAIPFGGFVKPQGEDLSELGEDYEPKEGDYLKAPLWARMVIVSGGVFMNFLVAFILFSAIFMVGKPTLSSSVGGFVEGYPAEKSGLLVGDKIISVNNVSVSNWTELTSQILTNDSIQILLNVKRENKVEQIVIKPQVEEAEDMFGDKKKLTRIGIKPSDEYAIEKYGVAESFKQGGITLYNTTTLTLKALGRLVTGQLSLKNLAGPIGIIAVTGKAAEMGIVYLLQLTALISATLAIFNMLPFPALDGGHFLFLSIEAIFRKPVSLKVQGIATQIGFLLLMILMVVVMYNDLVNLKFFDWIIGFFK